MSFRSRLDGHDPAPTERPERVGTVVVGGGQAGLAVGYYLARHGRPFVILDANERVGDSWRNRWDSLRLFTPARMNGLPGMRFPGPGGRFTTKDEMADYLESYAARFELPVRAGVKVDRLSRHGDRFVIAAGSLRYHADNVVVAMNKQAPWVPAYATDLDPTIVQLHSNEYRNPSQLRDGRVLVVGAGNSGAEIALEVVRSRPTWMAGEESGHVPFRIESALARHVLVRIMQFVGHRALSVRTPIGRKVRPKLLTQAAPLVRVKPKDLIESGVERVTRVIGTQGGMPLLGDGRVADVKNIIWCTGFRPGFSWIDLPVLGDRQEPLHERGVLATEPGLYFVGLHFLYALSSGTIIGVGRDAKRVAKHVALRTRTTTKRIGGATPIATHGALAPATPVRSSLCNQRSRLIT